jgi:hypothetical protein
VSSSSTPSGWSQKSGTPESVEAFVVVVINRWKTCDGFAGIVMAVMVIPWHCCQEVVTFQMDNASHYPAYEIWHIFFQSQSHDTHISKHSTYQPMQVHFTWTLPRPSWEKAIGILPTVHHPCWVGCLNW